MKLISKTTFAIILLSSICFASEFTRQQSYFIPEGIDNFLKRNCRNLADGFNFSNKEKKVLRYLQTDAEIEILNQDADENQIQQIKNARNKIAEFFSKNICQGIKMACEGQTIVKLFPSEKKFAKGYHLANACATLNEQGVIYIIKNSNSE